VPGIGHPDGGLSGVTRTRLVLALAAIAALAAWGVERLVVTDREAIEALIEGARTAVVRRDWPALESMLAEDYAERGLDRAGAIAWIQRLWQRSRLTALSVEVDDVRVEGDRAAARVTVSPTMGFGSAQFGGRVDLERREEGWRVTGMAPDDAAFLPD
jgi:hypothetical protein